MWAAVRMAMASDPTCCTFCVVGSPLAIIECKASHHRLEEALAQLDGYQRSFAPQFVFNQLCVALNARAGRCGGRQARCVCRYRLQADELATVAALRGPHDPQSGEAHRTDQFAVSAV